MTTDFDDEPTEDTIELAAKTMKGDLRKLIIGLFKDPRFTGKSWKELKEDQQRSLVADAETAIEEAITRAVDIIASNASPHVKVLLKQVLIKDNIKGVFECGKDHELRHDLGDAAGNHVVVVLPDASIYMGQRSKVKFDKDQPELPTEPEKENNNGLTGESFNADGTIKGAPQLTGPKIIDAEEVNDGDGGGQSQPGETTEAGSADGVSESGSDDEGEGELEDGDETDADFEDDDEEEDDFDDEDDED